MAKTVEYDANFYFPEEYTEMVVGAFNYDAEAETDSVDDDNDDIDIEAESYSDEDSDLQDIDTTSNSIAVPDTLTVVSQSVRTAPDGSQVVDIVIDVEDVPDAVQYDVRVTVV